MATYAEKLKDPRWQKKRLEILQRDEWCCQRCFDSESMLAVHHLVYKKGREPWEYENDLLLTLCQNCHEEERETRGDCENMLLTALKEKRFFADDLFRLSCGFSEMTVTKPSEVVASALKWFLQNPEKVNEIVDSYLDSLSKKEGGDE